MSSAQKSAGFSNWLNKLFKNRLTLIVLAFFIILVGIIAAITIQNNNRLTASAATCTWTGNNSGDFSDSGNWDNCSTGSGAPETGDDIYFPSSATEYFLNNDLNETFNSITIESLDDNEYDLSGNSLDVSGPIIFDGQGSYDFIFNTDVYTAGISGSGIFNVDSNSNGYTLYLNGGNDYTFTGEIYGNGTVSKNNGNIQTLNDVYVDYNIYIQVYGYFLAISGNSTIDGTLENYGGVLVNNNLSIPGYYYQYNDINIAPGANMDVSYFDLYSGNVGVDASNGSSQSISVSSNTVDLSNSTFSMRFFGSYSVGQTFTVLDTSGSGGLSGEFTNFANSSTISAEGWGPSSIINDVQIQATYTSNSLTVEIVSIESLACSGNKTLTTTSGTVTSGTINYFPNSNCNWVITPSNADSVTLDFTAFDTESGNDIVTVYDGLSTSSPVLGTFSGNSLPSSVTANSGVMLITFTSDGANEATGFSADWTTTQFPLPNISTVVPPSGSTAGGTSVTVNGSNFVSGQYQAINSIGNTGYDGLRGMVVDASGQYVTGEFTGSITLGATTLNSTSGSQDIYIAKIDSSGNYVWAVQAGGAGQDGYNRRQAAYLNDVDGTLMIAGYYQNIANFGATTLTGGTGANIFISKINKTTGAVIWARSAGGSTADLLDGNSFPVQYGSSIDVDSSGNIYLSGRVFGSSPTFGAISITLENALGDLYVAKLDSTGNFIWVKNYGATEIPENTHVHGLVVDSSNNIYASSGFAGSITIGATTLNSTGDTGVSNTLVFKLDSSGNEIWANSGGTVGAIVGSNDLPYDLALDSSQNLYLTGYFGGEIASFDSINVNGPAVGLTIYTARLNSSTGAFVWAKGLVSPGSSISRDMHIDANDNIWIGGVYTNSLTDGNATISNNGANAFFAKYDTSGTLLQLNGIGGTGGQLLVGGVGGNQVRAIYEYNNKLYIAGEFFDTIGIGALLVNSQGNQDGFFTTWVDNQTSVKVNGVEVNANFVSDTELNFVTPPGTAGNVDVVVTNFNGNAFTLNGGFEYLSSTVEIQNTDISAMACSPTTTAVNTTVNCVITTSVDLNTLSGSVNVRIGTGGSDVNCPITGSGTTLTCNNIPVGVTIGTFPSQYNASGSGTTYLDGNNIEVTAAPVCSTGASGTGSNGNTAITDILLCLTGGNLILTSPVSANFTSLTVSDVEQNSAANLTGITVEDLRGSEAGWSLVCKSSNLTGVLFNDTIIPVYDNSTSKLNVTPSALQAVGIYGSTQNGLTDNTSLQDTTSVSDSGSNGESNDFNLAAFATGYGVGAFNKNLLLNLTIPPYIRAQSYVGTLTCSVS
jgi:hypothetical protein